jgi:hypothetical protein
MKERASLSPAETAIKARLLVCELQEIGAEATFIHSDVRYEDEVRTLVDETVKLASLAVDGGKLAR